MRCGDVFVVLWKYWTYRSSELAIMITMIDSIGRELMTLPDASIICPGIGNPTAIGFERNNNPFPAIAGYFN
ncbi:MAG: hypothetical protein IPM04_11680 [Saprospiraceae bacterium]|nr:hypothetical protein [Candidatus Brachybacter algidus]MBK8748493.1 hypothetical protein [Candidatus Brachybacter algidus]